MCRRFDYLKGTSEDIPECEWVCMKDSVPVLVVF